MNVPLDAYRYFNVVYKSRLSAGTMPTKFTLEMSNEISKYIGNADLGKYLNGIESNDADTFDVVAYFIVVASLHHGLKQCGYPGITYDVVYRLAWEQGTDKVREALIAFARNGNQAAGIELSTWISQAADGATLDDFTDVHSTAMPPPETPLRQHHTNPQTRQVLRNNSDDGRGVRSVNYNSSVAEKVSHIQSRQRPSDDHYRRGDEAESQSSSKYDQADAYGNDVAIQFQRTLSKDKSSTTINIKCARAKNGGKTRQGCDWNNAIILMLTSTEVQKVLAVMLGYMPKFRAAGHGANNLKWFEVEETQANFAGAIRFTVAEGDDRRSVNVTSDSLGEVIAIFMRTLSDRMKMDGGLITEAVRRVADLHQKAVQAKEVRSGQGQGGGQGRGQFSVGRSQARG